MRSCETLGCVMLQLACALGLGVAWAVAAEGLARARVWLLALLTMRSVALSPTIPAEHDAEHTRQRKGIQKGYRTDR